MRRRLTFVLALAAAAAGGWLAADVAARAKAPRFAPLDAKLLTEEQKPLADRINRISSVGIGGPYNPLLRSPKLTARMLDLLDYLRWNSSLPPRLSEFAILIQARQWRSQVEWFAHAPLAAKAGLPEETIASLKAGGRPKPMTLQEAAIYDLTTELAAKHAVSDETFLRAQSALTETQIVDLVGLSGTYVTVAMLLATAEEGVPPGKASPFGSNER
jgi:4-carboxymuconolactone decarboxylase